MSESKHAQAIRKMLEAQGDSLEDIDLIMQVINSKEENESRGKSWESVRSWISLGISTIAMTGSFVAFFYKK